MVAQTYWNDIYHGNAPWRMTAPVVCKAGEGALFTDPSYRAFLSQADSLHFDAFAYYALHAGTPAEITSQARRAHMLIGARPSMFDAEWWKAESGSPAGMVSLSGLCSAIDSYRDLGGVMNVAYLPRSMWRLMGSPSLAPLAWRKIHIMNADYSHGSALGTPAWAPYGGVTPWALQYAPCHNTAPGTWPEVRNVWEGIVSTPPPPPGTGLVPYTVKAGDTMARIAPAHGMTLPELEAANPHAGHPAGNFNLIYPGDILEVKAP